MQPRMIALTSSGPMSGKTTLAKHLESQYGFMRVDHGLNVVRSFVEEWNESGDAPPITVHDVYERKEYYRPRLQDHSLRVGFSDPGRASYWTMKTLEEWTQTGGKKDVVFDPFRGEVQGQLMRALGFTLVQLDIPGDERRRRAEAAGKSYQSIQYSIARHPELEGGIEHPDIRLIALVPVDVLARMLLSEMAERYADVC